MTDERKPESKPEDLLNTTEPQSIELEEHDLDRISGGANIKMIQIKG